MHYTDLAKIAAAGLFSGLFIFLLRFFIVAFLRNEKESRKIFEEITCKKIDNHREDIKELYHRTDEIPSMRERISNIKNNFEDCQRRHEK